MAISGTGSGNSGGLGPLVTLYSLGSVAGLTDSALLDRFHDGPRELSERAFEAIVSRHGSMVLGVCRRALSNPHDVEDAFQATFLVLARRSRGVRGDSLGRWLHGVSRKIAWRARRDANRRPIPAGEAAGSWASQSTSIDEIGPAIDEEIGRLPRRYGEAVQLCLLEGLAMREAADRLGCRVGTVGSRLNRARAILRDRLVRRGVATAAVLTAIESGTAKAVVPDSWVGAASRVATSGGGAAVAALASQGMGGLFMSKGMLAASAAVVGLVGLATGAAVLGRGDGPAIPAAAVSRDDPKPAPATVADQLRALLAEYRAAEKRCIEATRAASSPEEIGRVYTKLKPNDIEYASRILDLARADPHGIASRDALIWILDQRRNRRDVGRYADLSVQAATLLADHHANDPDAVRLSLSLFIGDEYPNDTCDKLLNGFYVGAESPEARGLVRLAMAPYLENKAKIARAWRTAPADRLRNPPILSRGVDANGRAVTKLQYEPISLDGYNHSLRYLDPDFLLAEAARMYEEVIAECGDIPYLTAGDKAMEEALTQPVPSLEGEPLSEEQIARYRNRRERRKTLGQVAAARLDAMRSLVIGKPAPEIDAPDIDGKPMKLSDFQGKVVVLSFWDPESEDSLQQVFIEQSLLNQYRGRPVVRIGVSCQGSAETTRKAMAAHNLDGPQWHDGDDGHGPIASKYRVGGRPTRMVIDASGNLYRRYATLEMLKYDLQFLSDPPDSARP